MPHKATTSRKTKPSNRNTSPNQFMPAATDDPAEGSLLEVEHSLEKINPKTPGPRRSK